MIFYDHFDNPGLSSCHFFEFKPNGEKLGADILLIPCHTGRDDESLYVEIDQVRQLNCNRDFCIFYLCFITDYHRPA